MIIAPNFVDAGIGGPFEDTAAVCSEPRPYAKCIQTTSELHTVPQSASQGGTVDAAIGEIIRFRLVTVIPEGVTQNFQIRDLLPPGLTYVGNPSVLFVADTPVTESSGFLANRSGSAICGMSRTAYSYQRAQRGWGAVRYRCGDRSHLLCAAVRHPQCR